MDYEQYEDIIVEMLTEAGLSATPLPYVDMLMEPRQAKAPEVFVIYNGSKYEDPSTLGVTSQKDTLNFEVYIRARTRRGIDGIFAVQKTVRNTILGKKLKDAVTPICLTAFGYVNGTQNNWQYQMTFSFDAYVVEEAEMANPLTITEINTPITLPK